MWTFLILLMYLSNTTLGTPVVGLKKNMEILMADEVKTDQLLEEMVPKRNEKSERAMVTLNLPSNATSIRADIVDGFSCKNRAYGYYADVENDCQIFHVCMPVVYADGKENTFRWSFICPEETVFSQDSFTCMREEDMSFGCEESVRFYELNRNFGIIDSSMEMQSNEAEVNSDSMTSNTNMKEQINEEKKQSQQQYQTIMDNEKVDKIQKRIDEIKPESPKPIKNYKKKNSLRKSPGRKRTTTTVIPITTTADQLIPLATPTTLIPLEIEATTPKYMESLTTKYQRFTRRPDINKENKKKVEQVQKQEPVAVSPMKESAKKPIKNESITLQKRKRPSIISSLKHKINTEDKPLKNILKTSEIINIVPNQDANTLTKLKKKDQKRPPIPEPILIRVEEQPAQPSKPVQITQQSEIVAPMQPESLIPLTQETVLPIVPIFIPEKNNKVENTLSTAIETINANDEPNKKLIEGTEQKNENDVPIVTLNPTPIINLNIPSKESEHIIDQQKQNFGEKIEESMPSKDEIIGDANTQNANNNENEENKEEIALNSNKNDNDGISDNSNQPGIDQQSMIINLISSLVNSESSKVDNVNDKVDNSEYVNTLLEEQGDQEQEQEKIMENTELNKMEQEQDEPKKELNNDESFEMTTNKIVIDDNLTENNEEIKNSDHEFKITSIINANDKPNEPPMNMNKISEKNEFDAMQKFINQQHKIYNHMSHIPVKLLTDDQYENIQTKGDLSNSDTLNVIQRIEELLQSEVKDETESASNVAVEDFNASKEPIAEQSPQQQDEQEEIKSSDIQQSSEEIKPIYQRIAQPLDLFLLKDNVMAIDETKAIVKDTENKEKSETTPQVTPTSDSINEDVKLELMKEKLPVPQLINKDVSEKEVKETEVPKSDIKEDELTKLDSTVSDKVLSDNVNLGTKSDSISDIKKLENPNVSKPLTDAVRTSSRSLKHKIRIIDPRKRRFLFKADAQL